MEITKKLISLLLSIAIVSATVPAFASNEEDSPEEYKFAEYVVEKYKETMKNFTHYWLQESSGGETRYVEKNGKRGMEVGNSGTFRYMLFNIDDAYWYSETPDCVKVTVEYFDEGGSNTFFCVRYCSINGPMTESEIVSMTGTGEWKTAEIIIDDILIANKDNLSDFMLATWSGSRSFTATSTLFHSVRIEQCFPVKPISTNIASDEPGNILSYDDKEKNVNLEFENITDFDGTAQVEYTITNDAGMVISEGKTGTVSVGANQKVLVPIEITAKDCDIYRIDYRLTGNVPHGNEVQEFDLEDYGLFSIARTWQEGDEKNSNSWIGAHLEYYLPYQDPVKTMRVINLGGWGGTRPDATLDRWDEADSRVGTKTDGKLGFDWDTELLGSYDLSYIHIAAYGHTALYNDPKRNNFRYMPRTEAEIQSYVDYCVACVKEWDAKMDTPLRLEIWNEPNNSAFNYDLVNEDAVYYAKLLQRIYPAVKEASPRTILVGMVSLGSAVGWVNQVLDLGGYDAVDEVCIHPYEWGKGPAKFNSIISGTKAIQNHMIEKFGKAKPIIFSEIGWHDTGIMNESGSLSGNTYGVTSMQQARNVAILHTVAKAYELTDLVCWYDLQNDGELPTYSEHNFGLLESPYHRQPYAAKPSFLAAAAYNKFLPNAEYLDKIEVGGLQTAAYNFKRTDGKNCAIMWTFNDNDTMVVDLGTKSVELFDLYGNPLGTLTSDDGIYAFNLMGEPIYVMGSFSKFEQSDEAKFIINDFTESVPDDTIPVEIIDTLGRNLNVDIEFEDDDLVIEGDTSIKNGKASFNLKSSVDSLGYHNMTVKIYDDNGTYYNSEYTVWIRTPFKFEMKTQQLFEDNFNRWQAVVTVTNNAYTTPMNGKIEITADENCVKAGNVVNFTDLPPKGSRTFYLNLPEMTLKRTVDIAIKTSLDSGYVEEYTGTIDFTSAKYAETKPTIDGIISENEWNGIWVVSDRLEDFENLTSGEAWSGPEDLSLKAKFGWDEDNFYMLAVVKDDVHYNNEAVGNQWVGDGIQYGFEDINDKGGNLTSAFTESGIALINGKPETYRWSTLYGELKAGEYDNYEAVINRNEETKETIYEMAIPWDEIFYPGYDITANSQLGFSMMVNENDGTGRLGWIRYNYGMGNFKDAKQFGTMKLIK